MKLHGFALSNYYNMARMVLVKKGMDCARLELVAQRESIVRIHADQRATS